MFITTCAISLPLALFNFSKIAGWRKQSLASCNIFRLDSSDSSASLVAMYSFAPYTPWDCWVVVCVSNITLNCTLEDISAAITLLIPASSPNKYSVIYGGLLLMLCISKFNPALSCILVICNATLSSCSCASLFSCVPNFSCTKQARSNIYANEFIGPSVTAYVNGVYPLTSLMSRWLKYSTGLIVYTPFIAM